MRKIIFLITLIGLSTQQAVSGDCTSGSCTDCHKAGSLKSCYICKDKMVKGTVGKFYCSGTPPPNCWATQYRPVLAKVVCFLCKEGYVLNSDYSCTKASGGCLRGILLSGTQTCTACPNGKEIGTSGDCISSTSIQNCKWVGRNNGVKSCVLCAKGYYISGGACPAYPTSQDPACVDLKTGTDHVCPTANGCDSWNGWFAVDVAADRSTYVCKLGAKIVLFAWFALAFLMVFKDLL